MNFLKANGIEDGIKQEVYLGPASIKEYETKHPKTNEIIRTNGLPIRVQRYKAMMFIAFKRPTAR